MDFIVFPRYFICLLEYLIKTVQKFVSLYSSSASFSAEILSCGAAKVLELTLSSPH